MARVEDCHDDLEVRSVSPNNKVYIGEYDEKKILAIGLFSEDDVSGECQPRDGLVFGFLDKDGNEDASFVVGLTHKDDIKRTFFPTEFTAPKESHKDEVVDGNKRGVFIRDGNFVVENNTCKPLGRNGGACSVLLEAIVFVKRN